MFSSSWIRTEHVEEKPIANVTLFHDGVDDFSANETESYVEEVGPHFGTDDNDDTIENDQNTQ